MWPLAALVVACTVMWCTPARADRIVVIGDDHELVLALEDLVAGTNTTIDALAPRETPPLAELGPVSRGVADERAATATVWLSPTAAGATLVAYERTVDRFVVREIPYHLPLDATQAAETARMIRVMLRAVREPDEEATVQPRETPRTAPRIVPPPPAAAPTALAWLGGGGWFATAGADARPALSIGGMWRPEGLGATLTATIAPSAGVTTMEFAGEASAWMIAAQAHYSVAIAPRIRVVPALGIALETVTLRGHLAGEDIESRRFNPAVDAGATLVVGLGHRLEIGVGIAADLLLRRQQYATQTEQILEVPRIQGRAALLVGVEL